MLRDPKQKMSVFTMKLLPEPKNKKTAKQLLIQILYFKITIGVFAQGCETLNHEFQFTAISVA